jgi:hypothetical protein
VKQPRLDLPICKGWVEFIDYDQLTGKDYRKIRAAEAGDGRGEQINNITLATAEVMIDSWDVPTRPDMRVPRYDRAALDRLAVRDLYVLEKTLLRMATRILEGNEDDEAGDPPPPASV